MTFSDWITIVSIMIAVLFAVFKFDEWEIIRLKNVYKFVIAPLILLFISGVAAFFHSNPHPGYLNFFWPAEAWWNLYTGLWPILWFFACFIAIIVLWRQFVRQPPSTRLIEQYLDVLNKNEEKFTASFKKYERYFFENVKDNEWLLYQEIFLVPKWWSVAPIQFREIILNHPEQFLKMDRNVLRTLLRTQLSNLDTQLMSELEKWPGAQFDMKQVPLLRIFLGSAEAITFVRSRNILLPIVKDSALNYFNSLDFLKRDRRILTLKPIDSLGTIPVKLRVFYYINFINWYWVSVIATRAPVAAFYQYEFWVQIILKNAPPVDDELGEAGHPNYYCLAVDRILSNVVDWLRIIVDNEIRNLSWASDHFIKLQLGILATIGNKHYDKVLRDWYISQLFSFIENLVVCRTYYGDSFDPSQLMQDRQLPKGEMEEAFRSYQEESFVTTEERDSDVFRWIVNLLSR